jgi:hypothetical protein
MKTIRWIFLILMVSAMINCSKDKEEEPGTNINKSIVINELLSKNSQHGSDQDNEFDDWIELYNLASEDIDLSGFYLTDSKNDLTKWEFPEGTMLEKNGYLIVWADGDTDQLGLHTPYKLSALGETVVLLSPEKVVVDQVKYPATDAEQSWARIPNGTGNFTWATPTFGQANE